MKSDVLDSQVSVAEAQNLAAYLRTHPEATTWPPYELAAQFGLPVEFVSSVLHGLEPRREQRINGPKFMGARNSVLSLRLLFRKLTSDPLVFIAATTLISVALYLILHFWTFGQTLQSTNIGPGDEIGVSNSAVAFVFITLSTLLLHFACYFRHGVVRLALLGSVITWVITAATFVVLIFLRYQNTNFDLPLMMTVYVSITFVLNGFYAMVGSAASILGGIFWVSRSEKAKEMRTRQELISHLFDLQDRLKNPQVAPETSAPTVWQQGTARVSQNLWGYALGFGLALSAILMIITLMFVWLSPQTAYSNNPLYALTALLWFFLKIVVMGLLAVSAKSMLRAFFALLIFEVGWHIPFVIPIAPYGIEGTAFRESFSNVALVWSGVSVFLVTLLGSAAARVEMKNRQALRLKADDAATILAEIVQTEWQLALQSRNVCVLVVDVVKSSRMKVNANPLEVEFSFREYQNYVREIATVFEGRVHSTAGDGAVIAFSNSLNAFETARRIQCELPAFNSTRNRLSQPFRLRIGLHMGAVAGDLNDIQFTEVIDIAAHVEALSPTGGIALTQPVAEQLPGVRLTLTQDRVSGHSIFISNVTDELQ